MPAGRTLELKQMILPKFLVPKKFQKQEMITRAHTLVRKYSLQKHFYVSLTQKSFAYIIRRRISSVSNYFIPRTNSYQQHLKPLNHTETIHISLKGVKKHQNDSLENKNQTYKT